MNKATTYAIAAWTLIAGGITAICLMANDTIGACALIIGTYMLGWSSSLAEVELLRKQVHFQSAMIVHMAELLRPDTAPSPAADADQLPPFYLERVRKGFGSFDRG